MQNSACRNQTLETSLGFQINFEEESQYSRPTVLSVD